MFTCIETAVVVSFGAGDLGTTVRVAGTAVVSQIAGWRYLNNQNIRISFFIQQYPKKKASAKLQYPTCRVETEWISTDLGRLLWF
jgi:hypothetical protein